MATVTFRIKKGKSEEAGIKVRFKHGDLWDYEFSTKIQVRRKSFSNRMQRVKATIETNDCCDSINSKLNELRSFILNSYYESTATDTKITQQWLKNKVGEKLENDFQKGDETLIFFIPFVKNLINDAKRTKVNQTGQNLTEKTIQHYESTLTKLKAYEKNKGVSLKIIDINLNFHKYFIRFLSEEQQLNPNTIGTYISKIKLFCNTAKMQGLEINDEVVRRNFYIPQNNSEEVYLNTKEIDLIFNYTFESERLDNARDWLIISAWTGLRIGDLLSLTKDNIVNDFIQVTTRKTKTPVTIPIHRSVKLILEKNNGAFPKKISDQKYNKYIKEVGKEVGLTNKVKGSKMVESKLNNKKIFRKQFGEYEKWELISSHIGRRSFATNLYGEIDSSTIMNITGHSTEKMLLNYIKKTPMHYAEKLKDFWDK
jgi:integrase